MPFIVDCFCGAGGASAGIYQALGAHPTIAINHDPHAIEMHSLNHPHTAHFLSDVWRVSPKEAAMGGGVDLAWFSPDCTHFSKARGGVPVRKSIRDLAWVAVQWLKDTHPGVVVVENVEEILTWGPLIPIVDTSGNPATSPDGDVLMRPDPTRAGETFHKWVRAFKQEGYSIDWRVLCAADYGAPTIRKRLFIVARRDGRPIEWPAPTHARGGAGGLKPWVGAHTIIDWSIPCPSIFDRKKPLADNTSRRIAHGLMRYVVDNPQPFVVQIGQTSDAPNSKVRGVDQPLSTITTKNSHLLVSAFLAKHYGGDRQQMAAGVDQPFPTITQRGTQNQVVQTALAPLIDHAYGSATTSRRGDAPLGTITAGGKHQALVSAFICKYYSQGGQWQGVDDPLHTIPTKGRFGLVTCNIGGEPWVITDIGMRMLEPHELAAAQGFPGDYVFTGTKTARIARIGNSVVPALAAAVVSAQFPRRSRKRSAA